MAINYIFTGVILPSLLLLQHLTHLAMTEKSTNRAELNTNCVGLTARYGCYYEEGDEMIFTCTVAGGGNLLVQDVKIKFKNVVINETFLEQVDNRTVRAKMPALNGYNGAHAYCLYKSTTVSHGTNANVHILNVPTVPTIKNCNKIGSDTRLGPTPFQCSWKPTVSEDVNKSKIEVIVLQHQLFWSRKHEKDDQSNLHWQSCPHLSDGSCTWYENSTEFFGDESGSDNWENCVKVEAFNSYESKQIGAKRHISDIVCFKILVHKEGISKWAVVGITLGLVTVCMLLAAVIFCIRKQSNKFKDMKIEIPHAPDIQLKDVNQQDTSCYYDLDKSDTMINDNLAPTTPSTANSSAPLISPFSDSGQFFRSHQQSVPRKGRVYVKSKPPNVKIKSSDIFNNNNIDSNKNNVLLHHLLATVNEKKAMTNKDFPANEYSTANYANESETGILYNIAEKPFKEGFDIDENPVFSDQPKSPTPSSQYQAYPFKNSLIYEDIDSDHGSYKSKPKTSDDSKNDETTLSLPSKEEENVMTIYSVIAPNAFIKSGGDDDVNIEDSLNQRSDSPARDSLRDLSHQPCSQQFQHHNEQQINRDSGQPPQTYLELF